MTATDIEYPGKMVAHTYEADDQGGTLLPDTLVANMLNELRAMLPAVLARHDRTSALTAGRA